MKNTLEKGKFRILIYKRHNKYVGICYETGWVETYNNLEEARTHIIDGIKSLVETSINNNLSIKNINRRPPLKHCFPFHMLSIIATFKNPFDLQFTNELITPNLAYYVVKG